MGIRLGAMQSREPLKAPTGERTGATQKRFAVASLTLKTQGARRKE